MKYVLLIGMLKIIYSLSLNNKFYITPSRFQTKIWRQKKIGIRMVNKMNVRYLLTKFNKNITEQMCKDK